MLLASQAGGDAGLNKKAPPASGTEGDGAQAAMLLLLEQLHRIDERLDHTERQRNADDYAEDKTEQDLQRGDPAVEQKKRCIGEQGRGNGGRRRQEKRGDREEARGRHPSPALPARVHCL